MKGTLYEDGQPKGTISDFSVTPGRTQYANANGEHVPVGKSNATATFTSPIGVFNPAKTYEVRCGETVYPITVTKQTNNKCSAIIENTSKEDGETSLPK